MNLRDYVEIVLKRKGVILFVSVCVILGYSIFFFTQSPSYTARSRVLLRLPPEWQNMPVISMPSWHTRISLASSQPVVTRTAEKLQEEGIDIHPGTIKGGLSLEPQENTDFVDIYYTSSNSERAVRVLNVLTEVFLKYDRENNQESLQNAQEALREEVNESYGSITTRENHLDKLRDLHDVSQSLQESRDQLEDVSNRYGPKHPQRVTLERRVRELKRELRRQYDRLLPDRYSSNKDIKDLMVTQSQVHRAQREIEMANDRLADIQESLDQVRFNKSLIGQSASLVADPDGTTVSYPTNYRTYGFVALAGIILGISAGAFLEYLDDRIVSKFDVHRYLGLKVLGTIPAVEPDQTNLLTSPEKTPLSERYHSISALLEYSLLSQTAHKSILVTSSVEGEGKTTTSLNLAVSLAREGEKVLLMDLDLRAPRMHKIFGLMNSEGASSILTGSLELEQAMYQGEFSDDGEQLSWDFVEPLIESTPQKGLDVLPSGPLPSNPIKSLKGPYTGKLLDFVKDRYSIVLIDSPPLEAVVDPVILSTCVDGTIMVIQSAKATKGTAQHAKHLLEDVNAEILGTILNRLEQTIPDYYSYYSEP